MKFADPLSNGFYLAQLEVCHCDAIMNLELVVLESLPEDKKAYIVIKSAEQICGNLSDPHYAVGVFDSDQQLVGMAFLLANSPTLPLNGLTQCDALETLLENVGPFGVIATVMVHPDFRKQKFMENMLEFLQAEATQRDYEFAAAEVVTGNTASYRGFIHNGFQSAGSGIDPSDGTPLEFLHFPLRNKNVVIPTQPLKEFVHAGG